MELGKSLAAVGMYANPQDFNAEKFAVFQQQINPLWIEDALSVTGTATLRRRRLPADQVVWLVLGMALFSRRPIDELVSRLDLALPVPKKAEVAKSAVAKARARLGEEPMAWLFRRCAQEWAHASAKRQNWNGLALYGVDGVTLRTADSAENRSYFGGPDCGPGNESGYPVLRMTCLMALRSHLLAAAEFGPYSESEQAYAKTLWNQVPENSLTIVDKAYLGADVLISLSTLGDNRHWLVRSKTNTNWKVLKTVAAGDDIVEMKVSSEARRKNPSLPKTWTARAIRYQRKGFRPQTLLTSLLDPIKYSRDEVVELYHERWEIEMGYDEIKTEMLEGLETLRSKQPSGVRQELWGILLTYNLLRVEMERIANDAKVPPTRISFVAAMRFIQDEWMWCAHASPGSIPKKLREMREQVKKFVLPARRSHRSYPRAVKVIESKYPTKKAALKLAGSLK